VTDTVWLIMKKSGISRIAKGGRKTWRSPHIKRPALAEGEYAVLITVKVPDSAWNPKPLPEATITVPESALVAPAVLVGVTDPPPDEASLEASLDEAGREHAEAGGP
jgi:hypothetical protein